MLHTNGRQYLFRHLHNILVITSPHFIPLYSSILKPEFPGLLPLHTLIAPRGQRLREQSSTCGGRRPGNEGYYSVYTMYMYQYMYFKHICTVCQTTWALHMYMYMYHFILQARQEIEKLPANFKHRLFLCIPAHSTYL